MIEQKSTNEKGCTVSENVNLLYQKRVRKSSENIDKSKLKRKGRKFYETVGKGFNKVFE